MNRHQPAEPANGVELSGTGKPPTWQGYPTGLTPVVVLSRTSSPVEKWGDPRAGREAPFDCLTQRDETWPCRAGLVSGLDVKAAFNHVLKAYLAGPRENRRQRVGQALDQLRQQRKKKKDQQTS